MAKEHHKHPCVHCKKTKGVHLAKTLHCPVGMRTRIGQISFDKEKVYTPKPGWKPTAKMVEADGKAFKLFPKDI